MTFLPMKTMSGKKMSKIMFVVCCFMLAGCNDLNKPIYDSSDIEIVILEDGTRCAIAKYPGGLSCDWK